MKLINLFEETNHHEDWWEYLFHSSCIANGSELYGLLRISEAARKLKNKGEKYPFYKVIFSLDEKTRNQLFNDVYLDTVKIDDRGVIGGSIFFSGIDKIGHPPFKIVSCDSLYIDINHDGDCKSLSKIEPWFPQQCEELIINECNITSLAGIHKIVKECEKLSIRNVEKVRIVEGGLGLLLIKKLKTIYIDNPYVKASELQRKKQSRERQAMKIIASYLPGGDAIDCQDELIEAGLEEYAKL